MTEPTPTPTPSPTPTPTPASWHEGVEAETIGFWQNKGLKLDDPKAFATDLTKLYRDAEKHFGVPADQLLKMPKADAKPEEWSAFHQRLGAPKEAKEYDFAPIKYGDGTELEPAFVDTLRAAFHARGVPKEAATEVTRAVVKYLEDADKAEGAVGVAKLAEERALLEKNWGGKDSATYNYNHLKAMEGARRLGITPDAVKLMENNIGYAGVMDAMRKIGAGTSEDTFIERGATGGGRPTTREGAVSRKAELMADGAWAKRYLAGGMAEKQEMDGLNMMIDA